MAHFGVHEMFCKPSPFINQAHRLRIGGRRAICIETAVNKEDWPVREPVGMRLRSRTSRTSLSHQVPRCACWHHSSAWKKLDRPTIETIDTYSLFSAKTICAISPPIEEPHT